MARPPATNVVFTSLLTLSRYGRHVSEQQDRSAVAADHRSIVPSVPGVPWWAAVVLGITGVAAGFAFDLSHSYLLPILAGAAANLAAAAIAWATGQERPSARALPETARTRPASHR